MSINICYLIPTLQFLNIYTDNLISKDFGNYSNVFHEIEYARDFRGDESIKLLFKIYQKKTSKARSSKYYKILNMYLLILRSRFLKTSITIVLI